MRKINKLKRDITENSPRKTPGNDLRQLKKTEFGPLHCDLYLRQTFHNTRNLKFWNKSREHFDSTDNNAIIYRGNFEKKKFSNEDNTSYSTQFLMYRRPETVTYGVVILLIVVREDNRRCWMDERRWMKPGRILCCCLAIWDSAVCSATLDASVCHKLLVPIVNVPIWNPKSALPSKSLISNLFCYLFKWSDTLY